MTVSYSPTTPMGLPYGFSQLAISQHQALQLSTVYRCVEVISDAIASQTWHILKWSEEEGFARQEFHDADYLLNMEPNPAMSRYTLMKVMIVKMLLEGAGYIHIVRDFRGDPERLDLVTKPVTTYIRKNGTLYYMVKQGPEHEKEEIRIEGDDMIAVLNFSYDGITAMSTLRHAAESLGISYASESNAKNFFRSGNSASGIISAEGKMTPDKAKAIKDAWNTAFVDSGGVTGGGVAVMEGGLQFKPITINPKDAQLLESRQFNVVEICRFFGVHPSKVFDSQNLTYSNIESFQLGFLTDTISPLNAKVEAEFNRKLLRPSQRKKTRLSLNIEELLRANMDAKANYVSKMFQAGGYTVNEVRKKAGNPKFDDPNADKPMVQINMQTIDAFKPKEDKKNNFKNQSNGEQGNQNPADGGGGGKAPAEQQEG